MPILWENRSFSERVHEETTKTSERDCTMPRIQKTRKYTCKRSGKRRKDTDYDEGSDDNSEPITVRLGTITSYNAVHGMSIYPESQE